ncbi:B12-binding domain-containing protein [candidate division CSSED10-310 bacterium]|uniref:B12-binding domain-containing protein n=1 Tax=candidate division CSSED10-310 bacterium TaxID=2855610 RepID=A0ABV6YR87_UNCC1
MNSLAEDFKQAITSIDRLKAKDIIRKVCDEDNALECIEQIMIPALENMGQEWEQGKIALAQVYMGSRICEEIVEKMLPRAVSHQHNAARMAITVLEDQHQLGKRIVYSVLKASGFDIQDYGTTTVDTLIPKIRTDEIKIMLISTLMLSSALKIKTLISQLREKGLQTRIIVGGAPFRFDEDLWTEVQADAMGKTASDATIIVKRFVAEVKS